MCNVGEFLMQEHVQKKNAKVQYRWFKMKNRQSVTREGTMNNILHPLLNSNARNNPWSTKIAKADKTPGQFNLNGLHGFNTYREAMLQKPRIYSDRNPHLVLGKIRVWGDISRHSDGLRAEFAEVVELYARGSKRELLKTNKNLAKRVKFKS